jgi:hypothetical protein
MKMDRNRIENEERREKFLLYVSSSERFGFDHKELWESLAIQLCEVFFLRELYTANHGDYEGLLPYGIAKLWMRLRVYYIVNGHLISTSDRVVKGMS